jgi:uncharacterized protein (TIGR03382 family)
MLGRLVVASLFVFTTARAEDALPGDGEACACDATPAACDTGCACDSECDVDWSIDECSIPGAGCLPETSDPDEATLEAYENALPVEQAPIEWAAAPDQIACPDGSSDEGGTCVPAAGVSGGDVSGGCSSSTPGLVAGAAMVGLLVLVRRRRALLVLGFGACMVSGDGWDDAVDRGPTGDGTYIDVYSAEVNDFGGAQYLLANQPLVAGAEQPVSQLSLARVANGVPIFRIAGACGDQLVTQQRDGAELLGWAHAAEGDGTAALVELAAPDACTFVYETDPDAIADLVSQGYTRMQTLAYVWPPGLGDAPVADPGDEPAPMPLAAPTPCHVTPHSAVELLYSSPGSAETLEFLNGCPGEVIIGEKGENGPVGSMKSVAAHAAGGRTAFVLDRNGDKLRALLARSNGLERTVAYLKHKLAIGYDYIVIDEITAAPDFADGEPLNRKLRKLLGRMPARTIIPYLSIDIMQELSPIYLHNRRLLVRAFQRRARAISLEVYLHTGQVTAGAAPSTMRRAADRLANAVHGLAGTRGINRAAFTTIATSMHSGYAQYRYLDQPAHDRGAVIREVNALRHGSQRTRSQHGIGYYFVGKSDMKPSGSYTYAQLIHLLRTQALRFR